MADLCDGGPPPIRLVLGSYGIHTVDVLTVKHFGVILRAILYGVHIIFLD